MHKKFSSAFFKRRRFPKAEPWSHSAECEIYSPFEDQEGSRNTPANCCGAGNPIKGFPESLNFVQIDIGGILFRQFTILYHYNISSSENQQTLLPNLPLLFWQIAPKFHLLFFKPLFKFLIILNTFEFKLIFLPVGNKLHFILGEKFLRLALRRRQT